MSPGVGSSFLVDRATRPFSRSLLRIITFSRSPGVSTLSTELTSSWEIWLMCSSPLMSPRFTKAPNGKMDSTTPSTTSPTLNSRMGTSVVALRLLKTIRWRSSSTSRNFSGISFPREFSAFTRWLSWLVGTKPLMCSTFTSRPPRFRLRTLPITVTSSSWSWRTRCQATESSSCLRDSEISPSLALSLMMRNSRCVSGRSTSFALTLGLIEASLDEQ
mmetsp:Transcript_30148/g.53923  ORF Transcript_30148/g.53923 Transcript_30148/m.53923 type:complete len:217 (-) Transcript_30148:114-764(-)